MDNRQGSRRAILLAAALAAGCFLLGMAVQGILLCRRKKAAWFPVLCALAAGVPLVLMYL